jgi:hypothetical protein
MAVCLRDYGIGFCGVFDMKTITLYEAEDGSIFKNKDACIMQDKALLELRRINRAFMAGGDLYGTGFTKHTEFKDKCFIKKISFNDKVYLENEKGGRLVSIKDLGVFLI